MQDTEISADGTSEKIYVNIKDDSMMLIKGARPITLTLKQQKELQQILNKEGKETIIHQLNGIRHLVKNDGYSKEQIENALTNLFTAILDTF